ncbi:hypothetical protein WJX72_006492 [[Myrmecia] bisecta]|uniref:Uncharacterized protein n=1 Tax=[Myrmecia] bisecta TaxID=41462 RepID=A0AAW1PSZ4_9CHLO
MAGGPVRRSARLAAQDSKAGSKAAGLAAPATSPPNSTQQATARRHSTAGLEAPPESTARNRPADPGAGNPNRTPSPRSPSPRRASGVSTAKVAAQGPPGGGSPGFATPATDYAEQLPIPYTEMSSVGFTPATAATGTFLSAERPTDSLSRGSAASTFRQQASTRLARSAKMRAAHMAASAGADSQPDPFERQPLPDTPRVQKRVSFRVPLASPKRALVGEEGAARGWRAAGAAALAVVQQNILVVTSVLLWISVFDDWRSSHQNHALKLLMILSHAAVCATSITYHITLHPFARKVDVVVVHLAALLEFAIALSLPAHLQRACVWPYYLAVAWCIGLYYLRLSGNKWAHASIHAAGVVGNWPVLRALEALHPAVLSTS